MSKIPKLCDAIRLICGRILQKVLHRLLGLGSIFWNLILTPFLLVLLAIDLCLYYPRIPNQNPYKLTNVTKTWPLILRKSYEETRVSVEHMQFDLDHFWLLFLEISLCFFPHKILSESPQIMPRIDENWLENCKKVVGKG